MENSSFQLPNSKPQTPSQFAIDSEIASRWGDFLDFVSAKSIPFRLVCEDIELSGSNSSALTITISKKHTEETFSRNKDLFTKLLREFFANDALLYEIKRIERKIGTPVTVIQSAASDSNGKAPASSKATIDDNIERSELELALIQELGAIPV
jgi:hypothetical protein